MGINGIGNGDSSAAARRAAELASRQAADSKAQLATKAGTKSDAFVKPEGQRLQAKPGTANPAALAILRQRTEDMLGALRILPTSVRQQQSMEIIQDYFKQASALGASYQPESGGGTSLVDEVLASKGSLGQLSLGSDGKYDCMEAALQAQQMFAKAGVDAGVRILDNGDGTRHAVVQVAGEGFDPSGVLEGKGPAVAGNRPVLADLSANQIKQAFAKGAQGETRAQLDGQLGEVAELKANQDPATTSPAVKNVDAKVALNNGISYAFDDTIAQACKRASSTGPQPFNPASADGIARVKAALAEMLSPLLSGAHPTTALAGSSNIGKLCKAIMDVQATGASEIRFNLVLDPATGMIKGKAGGISYPPEILAPVFQALQAQGVKGLMTLNVDASDLLKEGALTRAPDGSCHGAPGKKLEAFGDKYAQLCQKVADAGKAYGFTDFEIGNEPNLPGSWVSHASEYSKSVMDKYAAQMKTYQDGLDHRQGMPGYENLLKGYQQAKTGYDNALANYRQSTPDYWQAEINNVKASLDRCTAELRRRPDDSSLKAQITALNSELSSADAGRTKANNYDADEKNRYAKQYLALLSPAYSAIKAILPDDKSNVVMGGVYGCGVHWADDAKEYLTDLYANGLARCTDAINVHPYDALSWTRPADPSHTSEYWKGQMKTLQDALDHRRGMPGYESLLSDYKQAQANYLKPPLFKADGTLDQVEAQYRFDHNISSKDDKNSFFSMISALQLKYASGKPPKVVFTEFGWETKGDMTQQNQAQLLKFFYDNVNKLPWVTQAYDFNSTDFSLKFGLETADGQHKASWNTFVNEATGKP